MGKEKMSFSKKVKNSVKKAVSWIGDFEQTAAELAIKKNYKNNIKLNYDISECNSCSDAPHSFTEPPTPTPTPTSTPTLTSTPTPTPTVQAPIVTVYRGNTTQMKFGNTPSVNAVWTTGVTIGNSYQISGFTPNNYVFDHWNYTGMTIDNVNSNPTNATITNAVSAIQPVFVYNNVPTSTPTPTPTFFPTVTPTLTATPTPTFFPTATPTLTPTPAPSFSTGAFTFDFDYMLVEYFFSDGNDMDTMTYISNPAIMNNDFLNALPGDYVGTCGFSDNGPQFPNDGAHNPYLIYGGDNTGTGTEAILFDLVEYKNQRNSDTNIELTFTATWYGTPGTNPVVMRATMWKGGTPVQDGFTFINNTATATRMVESNGNVITSNLQSCEAFEEVSKLQYNISTKQGQFI